MIKNILITKIANCRDELSLKKLTGQKMSLRQKTLLYILNKIITIILPKSPGLDNHTKKLLNKIEKEMKRKIKKPQ